MPLGNLLVEIAGLPSGVDAAVTVTGPDAFSQDLTGTSLIEGLAPGDYTVAVGTIVTSAVTEYTPVDASVGATVVANQTATTTVRYSTTLGSLQVDVTGLAPDADADIVVTGPNGFSASLDGTTTLTGLTPGTYSLGAETVRSNSPIVDSIFDVSAIVASVDVDSGSTTNATVEYERRGGTGSLWLPSEFDGTLSGFGGSQLLGSSVGPPAVAIGGVPCAIALAFDGQGNAWVGSGNQLVRFTPDQLTASGAPTPSVTLTSDGASVICVHGLAFHADGNLWVASTVNDRVEMFTPAQLATDGNPTPAVILQNDGGGSLVFPRGLAFDATDNLWVGNGGTNTVVGFSPAQLAVSGTPTPFATISDNGGSLAAVRYLAFDTAGNLWVSNSGTDSLARFSPVQLATGAPAPSVVLTGDGTHLDGPEQMIFDNSGNMWVANFSSDTIERYTPIQLAASGSPVPGVILSVTPDIVFAQIAFSPPPAGLPIHAP